MLAVQLIPVGEMGVIFCGGGKMVLNPTAGAMAHKIGAKLVSLGFQSLRAVAVALLLHAATVLPCVEVSAASVPTSAAEAAALQELKASLGIESRSWPAGADPCARWAGIGCADGHVVSVQLTGLRRSVVVGSDVLAMSALGKLPFLAALNASGFRVSGKLPGWLGNLTSLERLDFTSCQLQGFLPESLASLSSLKVLVLAQNRLSGRIPASLFNLSSLVSLDLSGNNLSGIIPSLFQRQTLQELVLRNNNLSGAIPGSMSQLLVFDASFNGLSGVLPDSLADVQQLQRLCLSHNALVGSVPAALATMLGSLDLSHNFFQGLLPAGLPPAANTDTNCLMNASSQRSFAACSAFYSRHGLQFVGFQLPAAALRAAVPEEEEEVDGGDGGKKRVIAAFAGAGGGLLLISLVVWLVLCSLHHSRKEQSHDGYRVDNDEALTAMRRLGRPFTYATLEQATSKFSTQNLMVAGHSGDLYRGVLQEGDAVVVKKIDAHKQASYATEMEVLYNTSYSRVVCLLGHCLDRPDSKLLVYKFMLHGDLASCLHRRNNPSQSLDWITRLKIAIGVAEGLVYLHTECIPPLVHRDIKSSSILLDDKFEVRLGSLSQVRAQNPDAHPSIISRLLGISNSWERDEHSALTAQDVYGFGKVLLELVSGQVGISSCEDARADAWLEWALPLIDIHDKEALPKVVDPMLVVDEDMLQEVWAVAILAKLCLNGRPSKRPNMRHVLKGLENPRKVIREVSFRETRALRTSSHNSWNEALFGSWRSNFSSLREETSIKTSSMGPHHSRRSSSEIVPEPVKDAAMMMTMPAVSSSETIHALT